MNSNLGVRRERARKFHDLGRIRIRLNSRAIPFLALHHSPEPKSPKRERSCQNPNSTFSNTERENQRTVFWIQSNTMTSPAKKSDSDRHLAAVVVQPSSPRFSSSGTPTAGAQRKIGIAVDLSDESAFAVKWAVQNYLRPGDAVILLHVRPTSVLYGADWGAIDLSVHDTDDEESTQKLEDDFDSFTNTKANDLSQPLVHAHIPFKIHIVKDHDMKERLCLEVERLGLSAMIMGSRGFGASKRQSKSRLGSVSDYCVHHCVCPVIVVRFPEEDNKDANNVSPNSAKARRAACPAVPEDDQEYHDASDKHTDMENAS